MAIAIALDDDLVGAAPQHRALAPALAPVDLIAKAHGKFAEIDLPFEGVEFAILIPHWKTPFPSLLPVFSSWGDHWLSAAVAVASLVCRLPDDWRDRPPGSAAPRARLHTRHVPTASAIGVG